MPSRRSVLLGAGTLGAGTLAAGAAGSEAAGAQATGTGRAAAAPPVRPARGDLTADVVVVGAGYAGLACARALRAGGRRVLVVEARDRVGGRCWNTPLPAPYGSFVVEAGAEFIGPTQDRMYELVEELGLATFPTYAEGDSVSHLGGSRGRYSTPVPFPGLSQTAELAYALGQAEILSRLVPVDRPWTAIGAKSADAQTVEDFIRQNTSSAEARAVMRLIVLAVLSVEPREISMLYFTGYLRRCGGLIRLLSTSGGAQQDRVVGGSQAIAIAMARRLGDALHLASPVTEVDQDTAGVTVAGAGFRVRAGHAVVAMAPAMTRSVRFSPVSAGLQQHVQLAQRVPMGAIWKVHCVYPTPFWRADGLNGSVVSDRFLPKVVFDNTPPGPGAPGVLMGFVDGDDARAAAKLSPSRRRGQIVEAMTAYFGPKAATPVGYLEQNWQAERWSGGGPVGVCPPGVLTSYGPALGAPVGRVHWASTETATDWAGYMEGAVRAGESTARRILAG